MPLTQPIWALRKDQNTVRVHLLQKQRIWVLKIKNQKYPEYLSFLGLQMVMLHMIHTIWLISNQMNPFSGVVTVCSIFLILMELSVNTSQRLCKTTLRVLK